MGKSFFGFLCWSAALMFSHKAWAQIELLKELDPDITIVNVGDGDRAFIAEVIRKIESCNPAVMGIDLWFVSEKDRFEDPPLMNALRLAKNDVLGYTYHDRRFIRSHRKFSQYASNEGLALVQLSDEIATYFTPLLQINGQAHEHFALKIIKTWDPDYPIKFQLNQRIQIHYTRTLEQYNYLEGSKLNSLIHRDLLENKIVLLGYVGPGLEDKHYTPLREVLEVQEEEPDTYGVVIIANEIRTLIELRDETEE